MKRTILTATSLILLIAMLMTLTACGASGTETKAAATAATAVDTIMTAGTTQAFTGDAVPQADVQTILKAGLAAESAINQQPWFFVAVTDKDVMAEISSSGGRPGGGGMPSAPQGGDRPADLPEGFTPSGAQDGSMPEFPQDGNMPEFPQDGSMPDFPQNGEKPDFPQEGSKPDFPQSGEKPSGSQGGMPSFADGSAKASLGDSPLAIIVYMDEKTSSPNPAFDCGLAVQNMYIAAVSLGYGAKIVSSPTMSLNGANHDQICEKLGVDTSLTAVAVLLIGKPDNTVDGVSGATARSGLSEKTSIIG